MKDTFCRLSDNRTQTARRFPGERKIRSGKTGSVERKTMNMKKKIFMRALVGAPIGLTISTIITIIFSLLFGEGAYFAVPHDLAAACGSEINAVLLQTVFALLYGAMWGSASVIWEMENWSLLKMTLTHLAVCSVVSFPIAYFMQWMPHSIPGALAFFGMFFAIYTVIWLSQYCAIKRQVAQMNSRLSGRNL